MSNQPLLIKPVLLLEDDKFWAASISKGIRVLGGLPVVHFTSVEKFKQGFMVDQKDSLRKELLRYSAIVCDNDFEADDQTVEFEKKTKGISFLLNEIGPLLSELPKEERPLLICYAPSSEDVIQKHEGNLWNKFRITSFNKVFETSAIGLAIRFACEWGVPFSRESIIKNILGFPEYIDFEGEGEFFFRGLLKIARDSLKGETPLEIDGKVKPIELKQLLFIISEKIGLPINKLEERISTEAKLFTPLNIEGRQRVEKET